MYHSIDVFGIVQQLFIELSEDISYNKLMRISHLVEDALNLTNSFQLQFIVNAVSVTINTKDEFLYFKCEGMLESVERYKQIID